MVQEIQTVLTVQDVVTALDDAGADQRVRNTLMELADPDFEVAMVGPDYLSTQLEFSGLDGFREAWRDWTSPFEHAEIEVEEMIDAGDQVVSLVAMGPTRTAAPRSRQAGRRRSSTAGRSVPLRSDGASSRGYRPSPFEQLSAEASSRPRDRAAGSAPVASACLGTSSSRGLAPSARPSASKRLPAPAAGGHGEVSTHTRPRRPELR